MSTIRTDLATDVGRAEGSLAGATATGRCPRSVDIVLSGYNVLLASTWMVAGRGSASAWELGALHVVAALAPWFPRWRSQRVPQCQGARPHSIAATIRVFYPLVYLIGLWIELGHLLPLLHRTTHDSTVLQLDALVFRTHWHARWMAAYHARWLSELMYGAYWSFDLLLVVPLLVLWRRGQDAAVRELAGRLTLTYVACCLVYLAFPVVGPTVVLPSDHRVARGVFYRLVGGVQRLGDSLGTAFPSTHVAAASTIAIGGWRWFSRSVALAITIDAGAIAVATVYTQNHYAIDAVGGLVMALIVQWGIAPHVLAGVLDGRPRTRVCR